MSFVFVFLLFWFWFIVFSPLVVFMVVFHGFSIACLRVVFDLFAEFFGFYGDVVVGYRHTLLRRFAGSFNLFKHPLSKLGLYLWYF